MAEIMMACDEIAPQGLVRGGPHALEHDRLEGGKRQGQDLGLHGAVGWDRCRAPRGRPRRTAGSTMNLSAAIRSRNRRHSPNLRLTVGAVPAKGFAYRLRELMADQASMAADQCDDGGPAPSSGTPPPARSLPRARP